MLDINKLREIAKDPDKVLITQHSSIRFRERNIKYDDVISSIMTGEIIEQYENDFPNPSCLILGMELNKRYIHVVCGTDTEYLWIITAYYPSEDKWQKDMKTRKV